MNILQFIKLSHANVIMVVWGKKLPLSLSVFAIMLRKRLPDGSKMIWVFDDFSSSAGNPDLFFYGITSRFFWNLIEYV